MTTRNNFQNELVKIRTRAVVLRLDARFSQFAGRLKAGFRHDQLRVPAGNREGGQWAREGRPAKPTLVSRRPRDTSQVRIGNRWLRVTPAQQVRLSASRIEMQAALQKVRRADPNWKPRPQAYESLEGEIAANYAIALQARFRLYEIGNAPFGPGPYAREWIVAPARDRRLTRSEQAEVNRIGRTWGCHSCGSRDPGTRSGNFIGDHQFPRALGPRYRLYPHCARCSAGQGGLITRYKLRGSE